MRSAAVQNHGSTLFQKFRAPETNNKILVAVSGGVDSMVLLYLLGKFSTARGWNLTVAHFNHQLRGVASDADEAFVRKSAKAMKLPFVAGRADVKRFAKASKLSIEMTARKLRHEFLAQTARQRNINTIALAHHADDQVELFFLRVLRGAGGGLAGMKWQAPSPADGGISLVRPLFDFSKVELEQLARDNKIRYREDATNSSTDFLRNRIRHKLLPLLRDQFQPALNKTILRLMDITGAETDFANDMAQQWLSSKESAPTQRDFEKLPIAVQRHVLKRQLTELGFAPDFDLVESLRKLVDQPVAVVSNDAVLRDKKGRVSVREHLRAKFDNSELVVKLKKSGRAVLGGARFKWRIEAQEKLAMPDRKTGIEYFDADKMGGEIVFRHWRAGDRFQLIGMKSSAKLQDLFTNQKIPRAQRHQLIVAESGGEIFWVERLRISENFKLTPQTKRQLIWEWRR
ncbi:MAG TPA: tRNA lysidine(34) synthetase TilS [Pseudomonadales bacterium]|nr:tRNA lysidine(34) synthetase TilS [Pseudomonadales bacterium]